MKYKVGDKVRLNAKGKRAHIEEVCGAYSELGVIYSISDMDSNMWVHVLWDNGYPNAYLMDELDLFTRFKLYEEYNSENGTKWTCVHIRDDGSAILDTGHLSEEFAPDGTYKYGLPDGDDFDICFDYLNTDTSVGGVYIPPLANTEHPYMIHFNVIDGKPDWENAKVTGV